MTASLPERLEIKPQQTPIVIFMVLGCAGFVCGSIFILFNAEDISQILVAIVGILFFGVGGYITIPKLMKREVSLILTRDGLEYPSIWGSASIPWVDIEKVGVADINNMPMLGLRLKTYDHYLANMSDELAQNITKAMPYMKLLSKVSILLDPPTMASLWSQLIGKPDPAASLRTFGSVGSLAEILMWNRKTTEYDVLTTWADLDRPAKQMAELIESYRKAYS